MRAGLIRNVNLLANRINAPSIFESVDYHIVRTREEAHNAYALVYKEYLKRNYIDTSEMCMRVSIHNALPETTTFVGTSSDGAVLCTATIIPDSPLGLPMDAIYADELAPLRSQGKKLCEVSMLASNSDIFSGSISMMLNAQKMFFVFSLFKCILDYTKDILKRDYICITVNPKHGMTYDFLLFKNIGEQKTYKSVKEAPAIAKILDLHTAKAECIKNNKVGLYKMFYAGKTDPKHFEGKFMFEEEDLDYFFKQQTTIFNTASAQDMQYLKTRYPRCTLLT